MCSLLITLVWRVAHSSAASMTRSVTAGPDEEVSNRAREEESSRCHAEQKLMDMNAAWERSWGLMGRPVTFSGVRWGDYSAEWPATSRIPWNMWDKIYLCLFCQLNPQEKFLTVSHSLCFLFFLFCFVLQKSFMTSMIISQMSQSCSHHSINSSRQPQCARAPSGNHFIFFSITSLENVDLFERKWPLVGSWKQCGLNIQSSVC